MYANPIIFKSKPSVSTTIEGLDKWLLSDRVCNTNGAVAGVIKNNQVCYWYNEIAGYYLTYLAHLHTSNKAGKSRLNELSFKVSNWLHQQWLNQSWLTRQHRHPTIDWRNNCHFSFDIAMVLRGLADAKAQSLKLAWDGKELADFMLNYLTRNRLFLAVIKSDDNAFLHDSWSTNMGVYQWKTLSGMLRYSREFGSGALSQQIQYLTYQLEHYSKKPEEWMLPPHPSLYAIEGMDDCHLLMAKDNQLIEINCLDYINKQDNKYWRIDVIAQKLRLMVDRNYPTIQCETLAGYLIDSVSNNGSIGFKPFNNDIENVWCAIFARQALSNYNQSSSNLSSTLSKFI